jgi:hypothetical protein
MRQRVKNQQVLKIQTEMMMTMIKKIFLLIFITSITLAGSSQNDDFGVWMGVDVSHHLFKKIDATLSGTVRTFNNSTKIEQSFIEGGASYELNRIFSMAASYRLSGKIEDNSQYYYRHKLFFDFKGEFQFNRISVSGRARLQTANKTYIEDDEDLETDYTARLKVKASVNLSASSFKPYIYCEPFFPLFTEDGFKVGKNRISAGTIIKITKRSSVDAGYIFQRDYLPHLADEHIISLTYRFHF